MGKRIEWQAKGREKGREREGGKVQSKELEQKRGKIVQSLSNEC